MQIQSNLASTIAMAFDECPSSVADRDYMENSVNRTTRWLKRCKAEMDRLNSLPDTINKHQMLFGINQGGVYEDIRVRHAQEISELDLQNLRHLIGGFDTTHCKMDEYARQATDAQVKQFFQKSAQSAADCKNQLMQYLQ